MEEAVFEPSPPPIGRVFRSHPSSAVDKMQSFALGHVAAFFGYRAFHEQYQERDRKRQHGDHPKAVEIGKRRRLLLTQVFEFLPSELLRRDWIGGLLKEERLCVREEGIGCRVEGIEVLAKTQSMELVTPLLGGLRQRGPDTPSLVAQKAQQADGCSTQRDWRIEVSRYISRSKTYRRSRDHEHSRPDDLPWADVQVELGHPIVPGGHNQQPSGDQPSG